jgi:hypothetical protein
VSTAPYRRIVRRETHSPRTAAVIIVVVLLILLFAYIGTEIVLSLLARPALLVAPADAGAWLAALPFLQPAGAIVAGGAVLGLVGLVLIVLSVAPGRLAKHEMVWEDRAVVVDNGVIAAAVAHRICDETGLTSDQVTVSVTHRTVQADLRPGGGLTLDEATIRQIMADEVTGYQLAPKVTTRVRMDRREGVAL